MKVFHIFDAADKKEYESWIRAWSAWPLHEVFAHPEYVKLFARECDRAVCAVQESPDGLILLPMIVRPLAAEEWAGGGDEHWDAAEPYGYGGPYVTGRYDLAVFWRQVEQWAVESGVISAFFRLSPFAADMNGLVGTVEISGGNVIRSLTEGREGIWMDCKHSVRTCVRRAEQNGVTVKFDETGESLDELIRIYYRTMQRCQATQNYYFSEDFFRRITTNLPGQFLLAHAMYQGEVIASSLVLVSKENIYPFLGGADETFFKLYPNEFLIMEIFYWGAEHGKNNCVLGGAYDGNDGLFQYKKKFAPSGVVPFQVGKHVFDPGAYRKMCEKRRSHESEHGRNWMEDGTYFPAYRAKTD